MTEMDEVRAQREKIGTESESLVRTQGKQIAEYQSNIKALEVGGLNLNLIKSIYRSLRFLC